MTFDELEDNVQRLVGAEVPRSLQEMQGAVTLAHFLNEKYSGKYSEVHKKDSYDNDGVDVYITESNAKNPLYIQVTHAVEYDMSPEITDKRVELSGDAITRAVVGKCLSYVERGLYTKEISLLIIGVLPSDYLRELYDENQTMRSALNKSCFNGIYYTSDKTLELKRKSTTAPN